jgi:ADP-heptose:LPS heptosyltransferase
MNILFVTSNRIGDAVLSTGLLDHLVTSHPGARITIACGPLPAPLFARVPGVERVIPLVKRRHALHWLALWAGCVGRFWDLVVDLRGSGLAWCLVAKTRRVLGPDRPAAKVHRVARLGALLGLDPPPAPTLWLGPEDEAAAARAIPPGPPVLALGPTANWLPKVWPPDRFAALAQRLTASDGILPGARFAGFGAPDERALADPVIAALPAGRVIDLVGRVDLPVAAACFRRAVFYVGNDSGLTHMAAAAGTPTLGLFGPSPPYHFAPWGSRAAVAVTEVSYERLVGAADFDHRDTKNLMGSLTVEMAEAAARDLWRRCEGRAA